MLFDCSYKGMPFYVESTDVKVGRRVVVHEYPFRDTPYIEDLGKSARTFTFSAFFLSSNYQLQANAFMKLLEQKGSGKLIHPSLGAIECICTDRGGVSFNETQRRANISLTFVECGDLVYPSTSLATDYLSRLNADEIITTANALFNQAVTMPNEISSLDLDSDRITQSLINNISTITSLINQSSYIADLMLGDNISSINDSSYNIQQLSANELANSIASNLDISSKARESHNWRQNSISMSDTVTSLTTPQAEQTYYTVVLDDTQKIIEQNTKAIYALFRQLLIAQLIGASSFIGTKSDVNQSSTTLKATNNDDVQSVRSKIISVLDVEESINDDFNILCSIRKARASVWNDLTNRVEQYQELYTKTIESSIPSLVLAYQEYGSIEREQEIVQRNNIKTCMFVNGDIKLVKEK